MKSNSACNLMSDKTKSETRNRVKPESDLFNPLISINYRLLIGQEGLLPIPLPYLQTHSRVCVQWRILHFSVQLY